MENKKLNRNTLYFFRIVLLCISIGALVFHFSCKETLATQKPIRYTHLKAKEHKGRGRHYTMEVYYQNKIYKLAATRQMYEGAESNTLPDLYYNETFDSVISDWQQTLSGRIFWIAALALGLTFLPYKKMADFIDVRIAKKQKSRTR